MRAFRLLRVVGLIALLPSWSTATAQEGPVTPPRPSVEIPRLDRAPTLEDFASMGPSSDLARSMARLDGFRQREPRDGDPVSQKTEAYLGYDDTHVYIFFVCFDSEPDKVRATLARREDAGGDDKVEVFLDTFNDQRRSYVFTINPLGVQQDGTWVEQEGSRYDRSFDTVWDSGGTLTKEGFVAWVGVPFKSLRFSPASSQEWGLVLARWIRRNNEGSFWPYVTSRIEGRLNQAGSLLGISDVSPGRNAQVIPYGFFRSFRALDDRAEGGPAYVTDSGDFEAGIDGKGVFRDSLVLDLTANPDFSQVESDEPQVTANERFEVFFPERRPFFLENASYFETPINLFFSRRIVDPQVGVRLTGKAGAWAIGALYANDRAPGERVADDSPAFGEKSQNAVFRLSRDVGNQSYVGLIYTDTRFQDSFNRVGGFDGTLKIGANWLATAQGVASSTRGDDGEELSGPAWDATLQRTGRKLTYTAAYNDRSPGFRTALGFLPGSARSRPGGPRSRALPLRTDFRGLRQSLNYRFRPEGDVLIAWGPDITFHPSWRHDGSALDTLFSVDMNVEMIGQTSVGAFYTGLIERLRPEDFPELPEETRYDSSLVGVSVSSRSLFRTLSFNGEFGRGTVINIVPPEGVAPELADTTRGELGFTWYATRSARLEGTYLYSGVTEADTSERVFDNHIARAKLSWQPTLRLSLRTIVQYNSLVSDPSLTSLKTSKSFNFDILASYLVNPWTAFYVGYNNNQRNLRLMDTDDGREIVRADRVGPDSWQFFVKVSYLVRF